ncbi:MAG: DUF4124 domain-containing protein [Betaproteobacteria bacterium]|jgi:hypothetical protein|nr:DUF4124 domain-containing protein [Betaproteobacteria bacterium]
MVRSNVIVLSALALSLAVAPALAQTMRKYVTPDGKTVYSDRPIPGARLVEEIAPPPPVDPNAAAAAQARAAQNAERAKASAAKRAESTKSGQQQGDAAAALARAKENLEKGKEPLPGERTGTAGGGSRLNDAYWARQRANEKAVKDAEARLKQQ